MKLSNISTRDDSASCSRSMISIRNCKSSISVIESLPRQSCIAEHRADLGAAVAATPRPEARDSLRARVKRLNARLEDSWLGDLIGVICLFGIGYAATVFLWVLE